MKLHRVLGLIVATQLLVAASALGQDYKVEAVGAAPADVPAAIAGLLDSQGTRVVNPQGAPLCEVWLRKAIPTSASPSTSSDIIYGALTEGTFIGVLHFPSAGADFRAQAIKPGFYTLRYGLIPQDGNHMGVNPYRDVLVLAPVAADTAPDKVVTTDDLVKLGRLGSGTPHPGFLVGAQVNGGTFPSVVKDDSGHWNLQVKGHAQSGDLPLAVTVVGKWEP